MFSLLKVNLALALLFCIAVAAFVGGVAVGKGALFYRWADDGRLFSPDDSVIN